MDAYGASLCEGNSIGSGYYKLPDTTAARLTPAITSQCSGAKHTNHSQAADFDKDGWHGATSLTVFQEMVKTSETQNGLQAFMNFGSFWIISSLAIHLDSFLIRSDARFSSYQSPLHSEQSGKITQVSTRFQLKLDFGMDWPAELVTIHNSLFKVPLWRHWFDHPRRLGKVRTWSWSILQHVEAFVACCFPGKVKIIDRKKNLVVTSAKRVFESLKKCKSRHFAAV